MPEQETSKKGVFWGVIVVILVLIIVFAIWGKKPQSNDTIRVGVIAPLTGPAANYGAEARNTIVLALDQINSAGGVKGKKIEYLMEDGKCEAKAAIDAWNKLVTINKVSVVFGGGCSTETLAIAPLTAKAGVPAFVVFTTAPKIDNEGEWLFRHISSNSYYGTVLAQQAYAQGNRKVALITEQKEFPVSYSDAFITEFKRLGGQVVLDERFAPETKDYRTIALKLKGAGNDATFISTQGAETMALIAAQVRDLGLEKSTLFNHAFSYVKFIEVTKGYIPAKYLIIQPYTAMDSTEGMAFNEAYKARYGSMYTFNPFFIAAQYDIVHRFKNAAEKCLEESLNVDCVRNEFKTATHYSGIAGDVEISAKYSPASVLTPISTVKIVNGKEVLVPIQ